MVIGSERGLKIDVGSSASVSLARRQMRGRKEGAKRKRQFGCEEDSIRGRQQGNVFAHSMLARGNEVPLVEAIRARETALA